MRRLPSLGGSRALALFERGAGQVEQAAAALGSTDPLVRTLDRLGVVIGQFWPATLAVLVGAVAMAAGASWAMTVLIAAGVVQLALAAAIAALVAARNDRARALIIDGRESLPLPAIAHERKRLLSQRRRVTLARSIEHLLKTVERWNRRPYSRPATAQPLYNLRGVRTHADELRRVSLLLSHQPPSARAVALVERLLTSPGSPLYQDWLGPPAGRDRLATELAGIQAALLSKSTRTDNEPTHQYDPDPPRRPIQM